MTIFDFSIHLSTILCDNLEILYYNVVSFVDGITKCLVCSLKKGADTMYQNITLLHRSLLIRAAFACVLLNPSLLSGIILMTMVTSFCLLPSAHPITCTGLIFMIFYCGVAAGTACIDYARRYWIYGDKQLYQNLVFTEHAVELRGGCDGQTVLDAVCYTDIRFACEFFGLYMLHCRFHPMIFFSISGFCELCDFPAFLSVHGIKLFIFPNTHKTH